MCPLRRFVCSRQDDMHTKWHNALAKDTLLEIKLSRTTDLGFVVLDDDFCDARLAALHTGCCRAPSTVQNFMGLHGVFSRSKCRRPARRITTITTTTTTTTTTTRRRRPPDRTMVAPSTTSAPPHSPRKTPSTTPQTSRLLICSVDLAADGAPPRLSAHRQLVLRFTYGAEERIKRVQTFLFNKVQK
eukprot:PhM_4_TR9990/c0_g1_i1/m.16227